MTENNSEQGEPLAFDEQWFHRFEAVGSWESFAYLGGKKDQRDAQKTVFLQNSSINPTLEYPNLGNFDFDMYEGRLLDLKQDIITQEKNEVVQRAYRWRINEKLAELRMLRATQSGDMRRFSRYSQFVYGEPSKEIFDYSLSVLHSELESANLPDNPEMHKTVEELTSIIPARPEEETGLKFPGPEAVQAVQNATKLELSKIIPQELNKDSYTAQEVDAIMKTVLSNLNIQGWTIVHDENATNMSVVHERKEIVLSPNDILGSRIKALIMHELARHVQRHENGERSSLKLLGLGLDRSEKGEEGVATIAEQAIGEAAVTDYDELDNHMAIALARGYDGTPRDFSGVFAVMEKYYLFKELKSGVTAEEAQKNAKERAYNRCVRTFRGTDCKTKGACYTKDIIYGEGNVDVWRVIGKNPEEIKRFTIGKYDPSNNRHVLILTQLGIIDSDLDTLQK